MPECPNCLRPMATAEDDATYRALTADVLPEGWPDIDGTHLCWRTIYGDDDCQPPHEYRLTPAQIRDAVNERDRLRMHQLEVAGILGVSLAACEEDERSAVIEDGVRSKVATIYGMHAVLIRAAVENGYSEDVARDFVTKVYGPPPESVLAWRD